MQSDTRRIMMAMFIAMAVLLAYNYLVNRFFPPRQQPAQVATTQPETAAPASGPVLAEAPEGAQPAPGPAPATAPRAELAFTSNADTTPLTLGGETGDALRITLNPRSAGLATLEFFARNKKGRFVHRTKPDEEAPYQLLAPLDDGTRMHYSFATARIWIEEYARHWSLADVVWTVIEQSPRRAVFATTLGSGAPGGELLRLTKTYTLHPNKPVIDLELQIENAGGSPLKLTVEQDGPLGIRQENQQYDMRRLLGAQMTTSGIQLGRGYVYSDLQKATQRGEPVRLVAPEKGPLLWAALANKYFAVFTRPLPLTGAAQDYVIAATGQVAAPDLLTDPADLLARGDLVARLATRPMVVTPGGVLRFPFEIYAGPKDAEHLEQVNPVYADKTKLYYQLAQSADTRCFCTFLWLEELMVWLMEKIHLLVRNYGVVIMILVVIIRGLLHPLSVWQQKSMFRMQESMARIQPKMDAIKERYANDKVRLNQEMMKVWGEEGVNPAASMVSFLPLFIQMPILVALWTALNTNVNLRHAPFDGWWIVDLSAPDAFLTFNPPVTIPILGQIPLLGSVFSNIVSLNLLPIVMGLGMWLQQKYMPKPHMKAKLDAARQQAAAGSKPKSGMSPEDQLRQQQIMAYMMAILMPLLFYKMPSGLNLYWLATTVFGIGESLIIRKQIAEEKARREREGPRPPRGGIISRFFKHVAAQAEQLQKKADELAKSDDPRRKSGKGKP